jgi:hypothetical protein
MAEEAAQSFEAIKQRIRANCYDCNGGKESELRAAVSDLEHLVKSGLTTLDARRLLADSYRDLALVYSARDSKEQAELLKRYRDLYHSMIDDNPDSVDVLLGYARVAEDVDIAQRLHVNATAALAEANFIEGTLLFSRAENERDRATARSHLQEAFDLATGAAKIAYGRRFADLLEGAGASDPAKKVRQDTETYRQQIGL